MSPTSEGTSAKSQTEVTNILTAISAWEHFSVSIFIPSELQGSRRQENKRRTFDHFYKQLLF